MSDVIQISIKEEQGREKSYQYKGEIIEIYRGLPVTDTEPVKLRLNKAMNRIVVFSEEPVLINVYSMIGVLEEFTLGTYTVKYGLNTKTLADIVEPSGSLSNVCYVANGAAIHKALNACWVGEGIVSSGTDLTGRYLIMRSSNIGKFFSVPISAESEYIKVDIGVVDKNTKVTVIGMEEIL